SHHPCVQVLLRRRDVPAIPVGSARVRAAQRHGPLGKRAVHAVFRRCSVSYPLIAKARADLRGDHRVKKRSSRLESHSMLEVAGRAHLLKSLEMVILVVMHAGEAVAHKLLRDECHAVASTLRLLRWRVDRSIAHAIENIHCVIRYPAIQRAARIAVVCATGWIWRRSGDAGQSESNAIEECRVTAPMMNNDRMLVRNPVQVVNIEGALVANLRIVEEFAFNPCAGRKLGSAPP